MSPSPKQHDRFGETSSHTPDIRRTVAVWLGLGKHGCLGSNQCVTVSRDVT